MEFIKDYDINKLKTADYNPRKITPGAFEKLKESLRRFGVCKAVIVNRNGTLVAGHQRTKAMRAVGIKEVPVFLLDKEVALHDEIRFNLMHNSVETETTKTRIRNAEALPFGFSLVECSEIEQVESGKGFVIKEISRLLAKYGDWGSVVINESGQIIHNSDYAFSCKLLGRPLMVYKMDDKQAAEFLEFMQFDYGSYNYEALNIKPYVQTFCQMNRDPLNKRSSLYRKYVLPEVSKAKRLLDFGAGKMVYVNQLQAQGYPAFGYEPHRRRARL